MTAAIFLTGLGISPAMIAINGVVEDLAPARKLNEAFTWVGSSLATGAAFGSLIIGVVLDELGLRTGQSVGVIGSIVSLLVIYLFREPVKGVLGVEGGAFVLIVAVIGGTRWMSAARLVRAQFLSLREKEFVEAARALGASRLRQVMQHILPNALGPVIVVATIDIAAAIIAESTLSFLGLGFPSDVPTWGSVLRDAKDYLDIAPHWALFAGGAIFLTVIAINFIGDGLRDALDPRKVM